jgi:methyl-accepting chemotaxis protein
MVDMETGLRGYMITGQEGYLEPYTNGRTEFDTVMAAEQQLTSDDPAAVAMLTEIANEKSDWLTDHAEPAIALRVEVEGGFEAQRAFDVISARTVGK